MPTWPNPPRTWLPGETVTDLLMNAQLRDPLQLLGGNDGEIGVSAPCARVYHSASQTVGHASNTALQFDSERFDTDSIHDPVTNNTRLTVPVAGKYLIVGQVRFASNLSGERSLAIRLNGTTELAALVVDAVNGDITEMIVTTIHELAASDYVELMAYHNSGGDLSVVAAANRSPEFSIVRVA